MSVGNEIDNGNKGRNFPFQVNMLKLLGQIAASSAAPCCPTDATEATLQQILNTLQQGTAYTQALVNDTGGVGCPSNCPTYVEVRVWNGVTFDPPIYYDANGVVVVPVGPVVFVNPQYVLQNILVQDTSINTALTTVTKTPNILRTQVAGAIAPAVYSASFYNSGTTDATVRGVVLKAGETVNFDAGGAGNKFTAGVLTYAGTATAELLIIYVS